MDKKVLAILDSEELYVYGLMEYFEQKQNFPFRIHVFTDKNKFFSLSDKSNIECLIVSEHIYTEDIEGFSIPHIIILSESSQIINNTLHHINKFQSCEEIYKEVIQYYSENQDQTFSVMRRNNKKLRIIGIYTPIGRCLQTTFAFTLGQILGIKSKTLYMNFERYSGLSKTLNREFKSDISDLMYYFECAKDKLAYRIDSIVERINGLDYIPPAQIYQNLSGIRGSQWIELFAEMEKCTEYEYLILDLTDGIPDLWIILKYCDVVYTITRGDTMAMSKMSQYEKLLEASDFMDVMTKTTKCRFPIFQHLPQKFEELTKGDLANFVKENILPGIRMIGEYNA